MSQEEQASPQTFDIAIAATCRAFAETLLEAHPELRSIGFAFDYHNALNDADVTHGLLTGRGGRLNSIEAHFGCAFKTLRLFHQTMANCSAILQGLRSDAVEAGNQLVATHAQLQELQDRINKYQGNPDSPASPETSAAS